MTFQMSNLTYSSLAPSCQEAAVQLNQAWGILAEQIINDFGSFENFKKQFTDAALAAEASGWTILVWSPYFKELEILYAEQQQDLSEWGVVPLLTIDVRPSGHDRARGLETWWDLVNWECALKRFAENIEFCH